MEVDGGCSEIYGGSAWKYQTRGKLLTSNGVVQVPLDRWEISALCNLFHRHPPTFIDFNLLA